jgi:hypothetical protein
MEREGLNGGNAQHEIFRLLVAKGDVIKAEWQANTKLSFLVSVYLSQSCHHRSSLFDTFISLLSSISYLSPSLLDHPPPFSSLLSWRLA